MPEGAPQPNSQEKNAKRSPALEAGTFAVTLLSALNHGPAQALEIDPHTSWITGVEDNLYPSVMEERREHATVFVQYVDGSTEWVPPTEGAWNHVRVPRQADAREAVTEARGREIARMCNIHTHPLSTSRRAFKLEAGMPPNPPSSKDISYAGSTEQEYKKGGVSGADVIHAVFDPRGIWYYRQTAAVDYADPKEAALHKPLVVADMLAKEDTGADAFQIQARIRFYEAWHTITNFVYTNTAPSGTFKNYKGLREAFLNGWSAKVRFVPWDKIIKEPACAGPDYDPKKGTMTRGRKTLN